MNRLHAAVLLILCAGPAAAQPWIPNECKTRGEVRGVEERRKMREAKPGSPIYAPKPFPTTRAEILEDLKYGYFHLIGEDVPDDERPLHDGLQRGTLTFKIVRVENWTPSRCSSDSQRDFFHLLLISDSATGKEVSHFVLNQNGLVSRWNVFPQEKSWPFEPAPTLPEALAKVRERFGIGGARAQYVTTWGRPQCPLPSPCVAFQAGGKSYLYRSGELVEFTSQSRGYSKAEMNATRTRRFEISGSVDATKEWLVSIADDRWVLAKRVPPKK